MNSRLQIEKYPTFPGSFSKSAWRFAGLKPGVGSNDNNTLNPVEINAYD